MVSEVIAGRMCDSLQRHQAVVIEELRGVVSLSDSVIKAKDELIRMAEARIRAQEDITDIQRRIAADRLRDKTRKVRILAGISAAEFLLLILILL